jgi:asparagine synthase (glutamine-hydrolysing)
VADVPFGVCLSGGIDSTLVALQMCRVLEQPVKAFAIGFDNEEFSELAYARQVADKCGIELFTEIVDSTALDFLPDLVAHYGEPFGDSSMVPTWHVSRLAREHVPMVLSGDGGDETFGGYASYIDWLRKPWLHALDLARSSWRRAAGYCGREISSRVRTGSWNNLVEWHKLTGYTGEIWRRRLWRNENHSLIDQPCALFDESGATCGAWDRLSFAQYLDYKTYLPCDILTKVDVASMYHGLEVRTPLLDIKVIELASALPRRARIRNVKGQGMIGKWVVKEILKEDFPRDFVYRGKQGFSIPRSAWFQPGRSGRKLAQELLLDRASLLNEWFKPEQIQWFLGAHDENHDYSGILWLLLILGIWRSQNAEISFT